MDLRWISLVVALVAASPARAEVPKLSGDIAVTYGRNFGQRLMVASLAGELKRNVHPQIAVGGRVGGQLGAALNGGTARGFLGMPVLAKGELFATESRTRPFLGLGAGLTFTRAAGVWLAVKNGQGEGGGWVVSGPLPTLLPEVGVDIGAFRVAAQYALLIGSANAVSAAVEIDGDGGSNATVGREAPGLNGLVFQLGGHFGGPR